MSISVIKVGGAFLDDPQQAAPLLERLGQLAADQQVVLLHGGGNAVESLLTQLGQSSSKINGLRVTPSEQIGYVAGALAGTVNKTLCALAIQSGLNPVGLSLADGKMTTCEQLDPILGNVGRVIGGQVRLLKLLLKEGFLPIISSIGADRKGNLLNINADQAATAVAKLLDADLYLLSDVAGVLGADKRLLSRLNQTQLQRLIETGVVKDGMTVKVNAALEAANTLARPVTIASWRNPQHLFRDAKANHSASGTQILPTLAQQDEK